MTVLAVTGLTREASIVAGDGVAVVSGGGDSSALAKKIEAALTSQTSGIISIGLCGALANSLAVEDVVVGAGALVGEDEFRTDDTWRAAILSKLPPATPVAMIAGSDVVVADALAKAALHKQQPRASAVDMESHIAGRIAAQHGIPFAIVRVISDVAGDTLPPAALVAMKPDGRIAYAAIVRSLLASPQQLPSLIGTGRKAEVAFAALLRCRNALGLFLGCPHLG